MKTFKESYDLKRRKEIYEKEVHAHPNKIAVVVEMHPKSKLSINKYFKFMANGTFTVGSIQQTIKKELIRTKQIQTQNGDTLALYFFCNQKLLKASDVLKDLVYLRDKQDSFLYLMLAETEAF